MMDAGKIRGVAVQPRHMTAHVRVTYAQPKRVIIPMRDGIVQRQSDVGAELDQVSISLRGSHDPGEEVQRVIGIFIRMPEHLVNHAVDAPVTAVRPRVAVACRRCQRNTVGI